MNTTDSGLQYEDTVVGSGNEARAGNDVTVHYTGWLYADGQKGSKISSSKDRNDPFAFSLHEFPYQPAVDTGVFGRPGEEIDDFGAPYFDSDHGRVIAGFIEVQATASLYQILGNEFCAGLGHSWGQL